MMLSAERLHTVAKPLSPSDPLQHHGKQDEADNVESIDDPHRGDLPPEAIHVKDPERDQEERQVAYQKNQPWRSCTPPRVIPGKRSD